MRDKLTFLYPGSFTFGKAMHLCFTDTSFFIFIHKLRHSNYVHESGEKWVKSVAKILIKLNNNWKLLNIT